MMLCAEPRAIPSHRSSSYVSRIRQSTRHLNLPLSRLSGLGPGTSWISKKISGPFRSRHPAAESMVKTSPRSSPAQVNQAGRLSSPRPSLPAATTQVTAQVNAVRLSRELPNVNSNLVDSTRPGQNFNPTGSRRSQESHGSAARNLTLRTSSALSIIDRGPGNVDYANFRRDASPGSEAADEGSDTTTQLTSTSRATTPDSTPEGTPPPPESRLSGRKKAIIDGVMVEFLAAFHPWVDSTFGVTGHGDGSGGGGPKNSDGSGSAKSPGRSSRGQKRGPDDGGRDALPPTRDGRDKDANGNGNGDGNCGGGGGGGERNKRAKRSDPDELLLACPFYKHDPVKYKNVRTCCGPGFKGVNRLKEHIYRSHQLPENECSRCFGTFTREATLVAHQRAESVCRLATRPARDGINPSQMKQLKTRSRPGSDRQKWEEVYRIIFPGEDENIPAPYYDPEEVAARQAKDSALAEIGERLRKEVPQMVRQKLEEAFELELVELEPKMKKTAVDIFFNCVESCLRNISPGIIISSNEGTGGGGGCGGGASVSSSSAPPSSHLDVIRPMAADDPADFLGPLESYMPDFLLNERFDYEACTPMSPPVAMPTSISMPTATATATQMLIADPSAADLGLQWTDAAFFGS